LEDDEEAVEDCPEDACCLVGDGGVCDVVAIEEVVFDECGVAVGFGFEVGKVVDGLDVVDHGDDGGGKDEEEADDGEDADGVEDDKGVSFGR